LQLEREATAERIATRIRTSLYESGASFANIDLARGAGSRDTPQTVASRLDASGRTRCRSTSFDCWDKECARFIKFPRVRHCSMSNRYAKIMLDSQPQVALIMRLWAKSMRGEEKQ